MDINYCLNMSINVRKDGKRSWVKKDYEKETVKLSSLESLREYLFDKRKKAVEMIPEIEKELRAEYDFPKKFRVVATYPRVFTAPKKDGEQADMEFLISFKVVSPSGAIATI